jgi:hypothetical protein
MQKLLDLKSLEGAFPRFIYQPFQIAHFWEYFSRKIDFGYAYLVHRIRAKYPSTLPIPNDGTVAVWTALTPYVLGDMIYPTLGDLTSPLFVCTVAGVSGAVAPVFPLRYGETVVDGGVTWTAYDRNRAGIVAPQMSIELFDVANDFSRQPSPVPVELFCTNGGQEGFAYPAPQPVDAENLNINMTANPPFFSLALNYLYRRGETLFMKINGQQLASTWKNPFSGGAGIPMTPTWNPAVFLLLIEGYYVPDSTLSLWKERKII